MHAGPLAEFLVKDNQKAASLFSIAKGLEKEVVARLGARNKIFPNVDFYSGIVYSCLGIDPEMFTPIFAVSRVAGWTARVLEYLQNNRIFYYHAGLSKEERKVIEDWFFGSDDGILCCTSAYGMGVDLYMYIFFESISVIKTDIVFKMIWLFVFIGAAWCHT